MKKFGNWLIKKDEQIKDLLWEKYGNSRQFAILANLVSVLRIVIFLAFIILWFALAFFAVFVFANVFVVVSHFLIVRL